jgi:hypothetical protein
LSRLFGERSGETLERSTDSEMRLGEEEAEILIGEPDAAAARRSSGGEPAPVEADEGAWQTERERRERDGREG